MIMVMYRSSYTIYGGTCLPELLLAFQEGHCVMVLTRIQNIYLFMYLFIVSCTTQLDV